MAAAEDEFIPTRASLLVRLKDCKDRASWEDFFETYWKLIYRVSRDRGLAVNEAEEVVQETMRAVSQNLPDFKYDPAIGSFKKWLLNLIKWRILDQFAKRPPAASVELAAAELEQVADNSCQQWETLWNVEWRQHIFDTAMTRVKRGLEPEKYQIFDCCVNKEWPAEKVAQAFGLTVNDVYQAKHRILELIRIEVAKEEEAQAAGKFGARERT